MPANNKVVLVGKIIHAPVIVGKTGEVCTFTVMTKKRYQNKESEKWEIRNEFWTVRMIGREGLRQYLEEAPVAVEGHLSANEWTDHDGKRHTSIEIVIDDIVLLGYKNDKETKESGKEAKETEPEDDVPF